MKCDTLERFAFIETQLLWGGGLTARELGEACGLARQNAQNVIADYRRRHPENIRTSRKQKRQVATEHFTPHYINPDPGAFLDYQRARAMVEYFRDGESGGGLPFHDVDRLLRPTLHLNPVQTVMTGLRQRRVVTIYYYAKTGARMREISPNTLIFASNRYHIRAYCHLMKKHLDFVVPRITYAELPETDTEWTSDRDDPEWHTWMRLSFRPNPALPEEVVDALCLDHGIVGKEAWEIRCRQALALYVKRELLGVDDERGIPLWILLNEERIHQTG